nr:DUF1016 N-terminal domain-containing protein [uncultured Pedobacter sp.]
MNKPIKSITSDFEQVILLITEARNRVYSKANAELVMLYFSVGQIVSEKVANGRWGDGTVDDLANYIAEKQPLLKGFNRRGLYRMKQFYEVYSDPEIVSPLMIQFQGVVNERDKFVSALLTQISWTNHLLILASPGFVSSRTEIINY